MRPKPAHFLSDNRSGAGGPRGRRRRTGRAGGTPW